MVDRFYINFPINMGEVLLQGPEAHHLANVRRMKAGEMVSLFNGDGAEYSGTIAGVAKKTVAVNVERVLRPDRELPFSLEIASAVPKGDREDFLIEKLTE